MIQNPKRWSWSRLRWPWLQPSDTAEITMRRGILALLVVSCLSLPPSCATPPRPVLPADLQWVDSQVLPGAKNAALVGNPAQPGFSMWRSAYPSNYKVPPHTHSVTEYVT